MCEAIEDLVNLDKLDQGFMSANPLEKVDFLQTDLEGVHPPWPINIKAMAD